MINTLNKFLEETDLNFNNIKLSGVKNLFDEDYIKTNVVN